ncbi:tRNA uridine 5-carbamoylmethylation protein Kti12 [Bradyrhizobium sp. AZCC 1610]|uniref:AAA family ATPase n=1 Tax=Bradyrhizobium sp. AZCC 1610 TaxID=3117020 RepID=UPI002FEFB540
MSAFVINLIGGPGSGKSTTAAGLFFKLKLAGVKCELVTEFAKELVYDENWLDLKRQIYVLAEQERRQRRLVDKVNVIITDAPLLTGVAYIRDPRDRKAVEVSARSLFDTYFNVNFAIKRVKPYQAYGRSQTAAEAKEIDNRLLNEIYVNEVIEACVPGDENAPDAIIDALKQSKLV